jgi:uncharacterized membrane protein YkoI
MKSYVRPYTVLLAATVFSINAWAAETKVAMADLPVAVQKAVAEQSKGAVIRGFTKEVEGGATEYEAQLMVTGHGKDISFDAAGKILSVEEEVKLESLPDAVRAAIQKAANGGTLRRVEAVTEGGKFFYEADIRKGGKSSEVQVDKNGARIK